MTVDRVVDSGCGLGRRRVLHAHPGVWVARCCSACRCDRRRYGRPLLAQFLAFAIAGGVGLLIVRPIAKRQMTHPSLVREGSYALVGKKAVVIEEVERYAGDSSSSPGRCGRRVRSMRTTCSRQGRW